MRIEPAELTANPGSKSGWWTPRLAGPLIAATAVRLALMVLMIVRNGTEVFSQSDTSSYLEPGRNLLLHGRFVADGVPDLVRTPGYPLFLAIFSLSGLSVAAVANVILSVFCVFLVWRLGRTVFGDDRIALGAAWIFAFEPVSVTYSAVLFSETLFLALFLLSMERMAEFLRGRRLPVLAVAGLWLAAATFVRPVTYYLPAALALALLAVFLRVPNLRWKAPAVLLISVLPWLAAWQIRNWVETGYSNFSSISEINLYFFNASEVTARLEHRPFSDVTRELGYVDFTHHSGQDYLFAPYLALHPEQAGWSQAQRLAFMHAEAVRIIRAHPKVYLSACLAHLFKTVFDPGAGSFDALLNPGDPRHIAGLILDKGLVSGGLALAREYPWIAAEKAAFAVVLLALYLFAVRGVYRCDMRNPYLWLLLGISLYFLVISGAVGGAGADARFRLPIMPVVCIFAAAGIWRTKAVTRG
jgi:hypothetical protein